jgi:hypothetical protein
MSTTPHADDSSTDGDSEAERRDPATVDFRFDDLRGQTARFAGLTRHDRLSPEDLPAAVDYTLGEDAAEGPGAGMAWWAARLTDSDVPIQPDDDPEEALDGSHTLSEADIPEQGFNTLLHDLPRVQEAEVMWDNPMVDSDGGPVPAAFLTDKFTALYDPDRLRQAQRAVEEHNLSGLPTDPDDILAHVPTDDYLNIPPAEPLEALATFLRDEGLNGEVFGEVRVAEEIGDGASMDVLVDGQQVDLPFLDDDRDPIVAGLEVEWDFKGGRAFRARGLMMDTRCLNAMRAVTNWEVVKHAGDRSRLDWYEWWSDLWHGVEETMDTYREAIRQSVDLSLDVQALPDDFVDVADYAAPPQVNIRTPLQAFYLFAGFPGYLAIPAGDNADRNARDVFEPCYFTLFRGATYAITHRSNGEVRGGGSVDDQSRLAEDLVLNPLNVRDRVLADYERAQEQRRQDYAQTAPSSEEADEQATQVAEAFGGIDALEAEFEERVERMRSLIPDDEEAEAPAQ